MSSDDDDDDDDVSGSESSKAPNELEIQEITSAGEEELPWTQDLALIQARAYLCRSPTKSEAEAFFDDVDAFKESYLVETASNQDSIKYDDESGNEVRAHNPPHLRTPG